jgi:hypothetical protein
MSAYGEVVDRPNAEKCVPTGSGMRRSTTLCRPKTDHVPPTYLGTREATSRYCVEPAKRSPRWALLFSQYQISKRLTPWPLARPRGNRYEKKLSPSMVQLLLTKGASPNENYLGGTVWGRFICSLGEIVLPTTLQAQMARVSTFRS